MRRKHDACSMHSNDYAQVRPNEGSPIAARQQGAATAASDVGQTRATDARLLGAMIPDQMSGRDAGAVRAPLVRRNIPRPLAICLATSTDREWEWNMSDPRHTDPYRSDQPIRFGGRGSHVVALWPWLTAAITAVGTLIGLLLGYNWGAFHERSALSSPPTTTGSAPPHQRPTPETR